MSFFQLKDERRHTATFTFSKVTHLTSDGKRGKTCNQSHARESMQSVPRTRKHATIPYAGKHAISPSRGKTCNQPLARENMQLAPPRGKTRVNRVISRVLIVVLLFQLLDVLTNKRDQLVKLKQTLNTFKSRSKTALMTLLGNKVSAILQRKAEICRAIDHLLNINNSLF